MRAEQALILRVLGRMEKRIVYTGEAVTVPFA